MTATWDSLNRKRWFFTDATDVLRAFPHISPAEADAVFYKYDHYKCPHGMLDSTVQKIIWDRRDHQRRLQTAHDLRVIAYRAKKDAQRVRVMLYLNSRAARWVAA